MYETLYTKKVRSICEPTSLSFYIFEIFIPIVSVCPAIDKHAVQREWWDHASYMGVYLLPWMCN